MRLPSGGERVGREGAWLSARSVGHRLFQTAKRRAEKSARRFGVYLGFAASVTGASFIMRIGDAIPKLFYAIVCFLHSGRLTLNEGETLRIEIGFFQCVAVVRHRGVFTAFAFRQNRMR